MVNSILGSGVIEGEGPVVLRDGTLMLVEMAGSRACVTRVAVDGTVETAIRVGGRPNGMTIDGNGRLWVAEAREGEIHCYEPDGTLKAVVRHPRGRFLWPNDLRFGPDGLLYLTDSGILDTVFITGIAINPKWAELDYRGCVYVIDPATARVVRRFDDGIQFTNGLAFGPDDRLYVNETIGGNVYRYDVFVEGEPKRELFGNVNTPDGPAGWRGPDGMAFGRDGRLYCTVYGQGDVTVLDAQGHVAERMPTNGLRPTNIAFVDGKPLAYVTEVLNSCVEVLEMPCDGLPPHRPAFDIGRAQEH
ncbi:SMP-30/gluconolactonase/LRE family protein [Shinella sp.]|uniref:SMP-30/gluconolactonase/LRE family protein n=1 Tax=Shinella sp. TaxID=1870904 RepID=UPI00299F95C2|nr:SMP-30/gluconolactonase/LRE family protein [Shinella sp.]MDX3978598.1 SMP-30/gluconolactonase/LRE family protein [Shinella sp.]